jgi:hypothetical protein
MHIMQCKDGCGIALRCCMLGDTVVLLLAKRYACNLDNRLMWMLVLFDRVIYS